MEGDLTMVLDDPRTLRLSQDEWITLNYQPVNDGDWRDHKVWIVLFFIGNELGIYRLYSSARVNERANPSTKKQPWAKIDLASLRPRGEHCITQGHPAPFIGVDALIVIQHL